MNIPLLDLKAQYESIKNEINKAVLGVLESGNYVLGPNIKALEEEVAAYCGVKHGIGVANGTDALFLSLKVYGIGSGDEVITTPYTFFATAEVISLVGATPVFVDIDPKTYNIDVTKIEEKVTERTKAIIPVHIFGQMVDMDTIMEIAKKYNLLVVEDACQAIGAEYKGKKAGSIGHISCFSFFPTKNLGGYGDGGMIVTNDGEIAEKIKVLRTHGSKPKYHHSVLGYNSRLDELQAAILRVKFKYLDKWNEQRRQKAKSYNQFLTNKVLSVPYIEEGNTSIYHLYIIRVLQRDKIMQLLKEKGIGCAIYYPVPLHLQKVYEELGYKEGALSEAEKASLETLAIPLYAELTDRELQEISQIIIENI